MMNPHATRGKESFSLTQDWRLITDEVMGGRSSGSLVLEQSGPYSYLHMRGSVTTENNGGFVQIAHDLTETEQLEASASKGIRLRVCGNNESYNLHLRTSDLKLPWQSFRSSFNATGEWCEILLPFDRFSVYKSSKRLSVKNIKRIGIVAIGRNFEADIRVADIGFY